MIVALPNAVYDFAIIINAVKLASIDIDSLHEIVFNLPYWFGEIQTRFMYINVGHPNEFSPYIWPLLGVIYEMTKPYQPGVAVFAVPYGNHNGITWLDAKAKPAEYRRQCKENFKLLKKDFIAAFILFAIGALMWMIIPVNNDVNIFAARPVTMFGFGLLVATSAKVLCVILPHKGFSHNNTVRLIITVCTAFVLFMAVPHIVREMALAMGIKANGTYDLTGLVLTRPKWYNSIYNKTARLNTGTGVLWYAVAGFVWDCVKPFCIAEKEQSHSSDNKER